MIMTTRMLEWFGHVKRKYETGDIGAVAEMKMEGKRPKGKLRLRWKEIVIRGMKAWPIREEWATDRGKWKGRPISKTAANGEKNICRELNYYKLK